VAWAHWFCGLSFIKTAPRVNIDKTNPFQKSENQERVRDGGRLVSESQGRAREENLKSGPLLSVSERCARLVSTWPPPPRTKAPCGGRGVGRGTARPGQRGRRAQPLAGVARGEGGTLIRSRL
jgi:hypothetical protein